MASSCVHEGVDVRKGTYISVNSGGKLEVVRQDSRKATETKFVLIRPPTDCQPFSLLFHAYLKTWLTILCKQQQPNLRTHYHTLQCRGTSPSVESEEKP
jgi:hypothetical protein